MKSNHKNSVHLVGLYTYCMVMYGAYIVKLCFEYLYLQNQYTNIISLTAIHRHDLQASSCIKKEIEVYNKKLQKMTKLLGHVNIIHIKLTRYENTRHGMHQHISGREIIANLIGKRITNFLTREKRLSLS